jgi:hypothetical protein
VTCWVGVTASNRNVGLVLSGAPCLRVFVMALWLACQKRESKTKASIVFCKDHMLLSFVIFFSSLH